MPMPAILPTYIFEIFAIQHPWDLKQRFMVLSGIHAFKDYIMDIL